MINEKLKLAAFILGLGIAWGSYEFYDFYSVDQVKLQTEQQTKAQSVSASQSELNKLKGFAESIKETKNLLKKTNSEFEDALEFIPRNLDLSALLGRLNVLATNSGIELVSFKPSKEESNKVETNKSEQAQSSPFYQTVTIELLLKGGFAQTVMFLDQVSRLKRILNVETLKMGERTGEGTKVSSNLAVPLDTVLSLKTYRFSE